LTATEDNGQTLVNVVTADAEAIDLNFVPYEEGMTGGVRAALVINPIENSSDTDYNYHWYYYDEATGNWYNKPGSLAASDREYIIDNYGYVVTDGYFDGSIMDDQALAIGGGYYVEYPLGDTIGQNWEADAQKHGYSITVGEFYITRQDGGEFE